MCVIARRVCLHHSKDLCQCSPKQRCLRYRYTLDELLDMLSRLKDAHTNFEQWARRAKQALDARDAERLGTLSSFIFRYSLLMNISQKAGGSVGVFVRQMWLGILSNPIETRRQVTIRDVVRNTE